MPITLNNNFKEYLIESIKTAGQMIIENAEDIAGKQDRVSRLTITADFDPEMSSIPEITITRSHLPDSEKLGRLMDLHVYGKKENKNDQT